VPTPGAWPTSCSPRDEAAQLTRYLREAHGETVTVTEVPLPMSTRSADGVLLLGASAVPCGGDTDRYMLYAEGGYDLPVQVSGYYSIDGEHRLVQVLCRHECDGSEH
jgi:hypothetical protein